MKFKRDMSLWTAGIFLLTVMILADLGFPWGDEDGKVLMLLRLPKMVTALTAGAALASGGCLMQSIFRNPLADPHIMGISSGASLGAATATLAGGFLSGLSPHIQGLTVTAAAFTGAIFTAAIIVAAAGRIRRNGTLLIFGVMTGFIVNAVISIMQFSTDAESLKIYHSWSSGSFSYTTWPQIAVMAACIAAGAVISCMMNKDLDITLFGDEFAERAGADIKHIRYKALICCCLMTGAVTAFCGPIGFVGIVAPHIARGLLRTSAHRMILPASMMTGCIISLGADMVSGLFSVPVPVSSTMALIGIPFILYIMLKPGCSA